MAFTPKAWHDQDPTTPWSATAAVDLETRLAAYTDAQITGSIAATLAKANNLSDLTSAASARSNLGLGSASLQDFNVSNGAAKLGSDGSVGGPGGSALNSSVVTSANPIIASKYLTPSGGDDSAAIAAALTSFAPFAYPVIVLGPGTFLWNSQVPAFLRNTPAKIIGAGRDKTIIKLSSTAPRAFDFNKVADGDTFSNIEMSDFSVDCNNTTGQHHVIIGTYVGGGITGRINVTGLRVSRIRTYNVPSATTTGNYNTGVLHRLNIHLTINDTVASGTLHSATDIIFRDVRMEGGNEGIFVGGGGIVTDGLNTYLDRVYIIDCWHSTMAQPTQFFACSNFQLGSRAFGDTVGIFNCYGAMSGDVGIEVDSLNDIYLWNNTMVDSWNCPFYFTNFHTPSNGVAQQRVVWDHCTAQFTSGQNAANNGRGWGITEQLSIPLGNLTLRDCELIDLLGAANNGSTNNGRAINCVPTQVSRITVNGFRSFSSGLVYNSATTVTFNHMYFSIPNNSLPEVQISLKNLEFNMAYQQASTGAINYDAIFLAGGTTSGGGMRIDIDDVRITTAASGTVTNNSLRGIEINSGQNMGGTISGVKFVSVTGDAQPRGILIRGQSQPLILTRLNIERCDFSGLPSGGAEILYIDAANKALTHTRANIWRNKPAPTTLTGLSSTVAASVGTGWDAMLTFTQGSGAGVTSIDYSVDGGAHFTNFLTQASGALPTGFDQSLGPLPSDAQIKVTFATTQPTINLVPINP